jgi:hypothetical protein
MNADKRRYAEAFNYAARCTLMLLFLRAEGAQELEPSSLHYFGQARLAASAFIGGYLLPCFLFRDLCDFVMKLLSFQRT